MNVIEPGDTLLVGCNGLWGERVSRLGERFVCMIPTPHAQPKSRHHHTCLWTELDRLSTHPPPTSLGANVKGIQVPAGEGFELSQIENGLRALGKRREAMLLNASCRAHRLPSLPSLPQASTVQRPSFSPTARAAWVCSSRSRASGPSATNTVCDGVLLLPQGS